MSDNATKPPVAATKESSLSKPLIIAVIGIILVAAAAILSFSQQSPLSPNRGARTAGVSTPNLPSFDVVRVDAKGNTVMAGRAPAGSTVIILDGETELGRVVADARGEWVFTPDAPLPPGNRQLSLKVPQADGKVLMSENIVVMSVPEQGGEVLIVEQNREGGKSRVLQGPEAAPELKTLNVETADYDSQGKVSLSGKAEPGATVQVYLDNTFVGRGVADDKGYWQLESAAKAAVGTHVLRADQVGVNNSVIARVEVRFTVDPTQLNGPVGAVTIVKGNSLWRIARRVYGEGTMYTVIFQANKEAIKDPNLIYPGQVFNLPVRDRI